MFRRATSLWAVLLLGWWGAAAAAECGGGVPCQCGDVVTRSTTLAAGVGICPGTGLEVRAGVVLDCAGHSVTGSGRPGAWYGIHLNPATGAEVRNCRVTGFKRGIRIAGGRDNRIVSNTSVGNWGYGIEIAGGSTGNLIEGNRVGAPSGSGTVRADEGIHNGSGSHGTVIRGNTVIDSKAENIYVLRSNHVQIVSNTVSEAESAGIFLKHSHGARVAHNTVAQGSITVRGDSSGNVLEANTITAGRGYLFEAHQEREDDAWPGYWTFPRRNTVLGGTVRSPVVIPNTDPPIRPCLRFEGAYKNRVEGLHLDRACTPPSETPEGGQPSVGNVVDILFLP